MLAKFARVRRRDVGLEGLLSRPLFYDGKVVRQIHLLEHLVAHVARVRVGVNAHGLEQSQETILVRREDINVGEDMDCASSTLTLLRSDINTAVDPLVVRCAPNRLQSVAEPQGARGYVIAVERGFILPDFQDRKAGRTRDLMQHVEAQIAGLLAACISVSLEQCRARSDCVRQGLDIGYDINRAVLGVRRYSKRRSQNRHSQEKLKDEAQLRPSCSIPAAAWRHLLA